MATATETHILTLAQWLSPAYPIGAFAYSHGLEGAVDQAWVKDAASLESWLADVLNHGGGQSDALLIAAAMKAANDTELAKIDATARAFAATKDRLLETSQQGASFATVTCSVWGTGLSSYTYPVALGAAAASVGLPIGLTQIMYLQAFASNLIAAGQRLLPVGQTEGQAILRRLAPRLPEIAEDTAHGDISRISATAFLGDIASMKHETQYSRIFRT